jgi:excisionase family DNA binding protein
MVMESLGSILNRLLTRYMVAGRLHISVRTVDRMIRAGRLKAVKLGRSVRIPEDEVNRIAANGTDGLKNGGAK